MFSLPTHTHTFYTHTYILHTHIHYTHTYILHTHIHSTHTHIHSTHTHVHSTHTYIHILYGLLHLFTTYQVQIEGTKCLRYYIPSTTSSGQWVVNKWQYGRCNDNYHVSKWWVTVMLFHAKYLSRPSNVSSFSWVK